MRAMKGAAGGFGVALGGGTARAFAHIGVLRALEARGFRPSAVAGTSSGAMFAAMYALGSTAFELEHWSRQLDVGELWRQGLDPGLGQAALIRGRRLERWLDRKVFGGATFDEVALPLAISCTDLATGELVVIREGPISRAVSASCALPGFFAPVVDGDRVFVDGGFVETVPFTALAATGPWRPLGIHAGIDARRSRVISLVRAAYATAPGRAWTGWLARRRGRDPWSRLARGFALATASYERSVAAPEGGWLLATRPQIAWWDFHRSLEAIASGVLAVEAAWERDGLETWLRGAATVGEPVA